MAQDYTDAQKRFILDDEVLKFEVFLDRFMNENTKDISFVDSALGLLLKIYQLHRQGKYLTKTQACAQVRSRNPSSKQKYVEEAQRRGFIRITADPNYKGGRRFIVEPLPALLQFVEDYIEGVAEHQRQFIGVLASIAPLPDDNQLMAGFEIKTGAEGHAPRQRDREMSMRSYIMSFVSRFSPKHLMGA